VDAVPHLGPLCPDYDRRAALSDSEFWEEVSGSPPLQEEDFLDEPVSGSYQPCPVCHEVGHCATDSEGRPLVHAEGLESSDD
jgi:hypothetical protein